MQKVAKVEAVAVVVARAEVVKDIILTKVEEVEADTTAKVAGSRKVVKVILTTILIVYVFAAVKLGIRPLIVLMQESLQRLSTSGKITVEIKDNNRKELKMVRISPQNTRITVTTLL
jgi:hypothetical protein